MADPQIAFITADLRKFAEGELIGLTLEINANLQEACPVDLGWARAGFVPTFGQPYDGGADLNPDSSDLGGARAIQQGAEAGLLSYQLGDGPLFSTNNVSYIIPLANGHSLQAPAGWVPDAIEKAVADFSK